MNRLGNKVFSSVLACVVAASLAACGGGSHSSAVPSAVQPPGTVSPSELVSATFKIVIPAPVKTGATARRPAYISAATKSIRINMTASTRNPAPSPAGQFNVLTQVTNGGNAPAAPCTGSGPWTCTVTMQVPPGSDTFTFTTYDDTTGTGTGASHILSQQIKTLTVVVGKANSPASDANYNIIFDANANAMAVNTTSGFCAGSFTVAANQTVPTIGTSALTFNVSYTDPAGKAIVTPGLPVLSVNGHTDTNGGAGYTIVGTGGTVNVKVTQSTQSYVLQASGSGVTATINVAATPANSTGSSDGLAFNQTLTHSFQAGSAPPANLLAAIEQTGAASGKIDLFILNTATNAFSPNSPATLSNQGGDVDFPQDILFDTNGDMMIANGGAGNPDFGNFACVPAGAITTGANVATVLTNNMNDPKFIEIGTDSSVALGNVPASSTTKTPTFVLNGTYTAASSTRTITNTDYPSLGVTGLVAVPTSATHPAGSYAVTLTNGTTTSHVVVKHPDGTVLQIDNANLVAPSLGIDTNASPNQLVAASKNGAHSYINFFNLLTGALIKQFVIQDTGCYSSGTTPYAGCPPNTASGFSNMKADITAVSSSGYVAVSGITQSGEPEVQVYDNTSNRNQVGGPIPYDATTTSGGATWNYNTSGGASPNIIVHAMRWVTATKLLVSLETGNAATQGLYLYDVTQLGSGCVAPASTTGCFDANGNVYPNTVKLVGFQALTNIPLSVAYKP